MKNIHNKYTGDTYPECLTDFGMLNRTRYRIDFTVNRFMGATDTTLNSNFGQNGISRSRCVVIWGPSSVKQRPNHIYGGVGS